MRGRSDLTARPGLVNAPPEARGPTCGSCTEAITRDTPLLNNTIPSDRGETLRVRTQRIENSPYARFYANAETVFGVYANRFVCVFNGEDFIDEYWTLRRRAVLYDVPERPVQIEGPDAVAFLEHVFARRVADLGEGRGRYAIACTPSGGVFMDGILFKLAEGKFWYVQADGALDAWFTAHAGRFDVTVSDPGSRVLQIQGPRSTAVMHAATGGAIDEAMRYFRSGFFDLGGQTLYVSRTGWTGEVGYEIYSNGAATDYQHLWSHLMTAGTAHGMAFAATRSMSIRRVEAGILDNGSDIDTSMTPFQAGLGPFINMDGDDFVGRDALLAADRDVLLHGVRCEAAAPDRGWAVVYEGRTVGRVTVGDWSPFLECGIGYVRFEQPGDWVGRTLSLKNPAGETCEGTVVTLPFYDPDKRIPRGLDASIP